MTGSYLKVLLVVGLICGAFQLLVLFEGRFRQKEDGVFVSAPLLRQVLAEWALYMLVFGVLSLLVYKLIGFLCSYCSTR